ESRLITRQFETSQALKEYVTVIHANDQEAREMLQDNKVAGVIVIPRDFIASLYEGENKSVKFVGNPQQRMAANLIKNQLVSAANLVSAGQSGVITVWRFTKWGGASYPVVEEQFNKAMLSFTMNSMGRFRLFEEMTVSAIPKVTPAEYFTSALLIIFASFLGMRGMRSLVEEKSNGIWERLKASPVKPWQVVLGKFLAVFLMVFGQIAISFLLTVLIFKNYMGGSLMNALLVLLGSSFAVAGWSMLIAALAPSAQSAELIGYTVTPLMAVVGGNIYPLSSLPEGIRTISGLTFNKWAMDGFLRVFSGERGPMVSNEVLALFAIGLSLVLAASIGLSLVGRKYA
ncbi:MAG TPA: ABC transporter permease, partial [Verrucomicrobiae bacterium]|nr:ABC transporter permease [Verrucomicrobiae bacterium]